MSRINAGIPPKDLTDRHLIAEHREIKRIPNIIKKGKLSGTGAPAEFTLGTGHIKFFYDKQQYLLDRYKDLYAECLRRGFNVQDYSTAWDGLPPELMNNYTPTPRDRKIVRERIAERLEAMKQ